MVGYNQIKVTETVGETKLIKTRCKVDLQKIKRIRKCKKLTYSDMAAALGYKSPNGYFYLESGRCQISAEQLAIISTKLEVDLQELYIMDDPAETEEQSA
jgi:transcriptional regulator with XRE-family HTH domain